MSRFPDIADVSFLGDITLSGLKSLAVETYKSEMSALTGKNLTSVPDENKAVLYAAAQIFYQAAEALDTKARQNLLKYASGGYLDNLALSRGLTRKTAEKAVVAVRFTLSSVRANTVAIPQGTRITNQTGSIYFETVGYQEIPPGEISADVNCAAQTAGSEANSFGIGELNILVDPIAYVAAVSNISIPEGGADEESDDDLAQRIFMARHSFSTAGSEQAYIYHTKDFSTLIDDVIVTNPEEAQIYIYILMKNRERASAAFLEAVKAHLDKSEIRPLTDKITVMNANFVNYDIDVLYTIYASDVSRLSEISAAVETAVSEYKEWQSEKIGREINNQKLISLMIAAGAATVEVLSPANKGVAPEEIACCKNVNITYKGYAEE